MALSNNDYKEFHRIPGNQVVWRNICDNPDAMYYRKNNRYFAIRLDDEFAASLTDSEWPVIWKEETDDEGNVRMQGYLKIYMKVHPDYPMGLYIINSDERSKVPVTVEYLDEINIDRKPIDYISIKIHPYNWSYRNETGVKILLSAMDIMLADTGYTLNDGLEIVDNFS